MVLNNLFLGKSLKVLVLSSEHMHYESIPFSPETSYVIVNFLKRSFIEFGSKS